MGFLFSSPQKVEKEPIKQSKIQNVDIIKIKLKHVRDKIKQYINLKTKQQQSLNLKIKELIPEYEETGCKKKMMPYLSLKKDLRMAIQKAQIQMKLIIDSLNDVEMNELNKQTIDAVEQSNKHIDEVMKEMEAKNWQNVLLEAQNKYQIEWPQDEQNLDEDPTFQQLWKQVGGDKLDQQTNMQVKKKKVQNKTVKVQVPKQKHHQNQIQLA